MSFKVATLQISVIHVLKKEQENYSLHVIKISLKPRLTSIVEITHIDIYIQKKSIFIYKYVCVCKRIKVAFSAFEEALPKLSLFHRL